MECFGVELKAFRLLSKGGLITELRKRVGKQYMPSSGLTRSHPKPEHLHTPKSAYLSSSISLDQPSGYLTFPDDVGVIYAHLQGRNYSYLIDLDRQHVWYCNPMRRVLLPASDKWMVFDQAEEDLLFLKHQLDEYL